MKLLFPIAFEFNYIILKILFFYSKLINKYNNSIKHFFYLGLKLTCLEKRLFTKKKNMINYLNFG